MRVIASVHLPGGALAPASCQLLDDPLHGFYIVAIRAEVPRFGKSRAIGVEAFCQCQVAVQRLQHVLPGSGGMRVADLHGAVGRKGFWDVGDQAVPGPVTAANHVARACRGQATPWWAWSAGLKKEER